MPPGSSESTRPGGGTVRIISKPKNIVFPAAVRVMHESGEEVWEANKTTGEIVSLTTFGKRAIFIMSLSEGRTRIEILSGLSGIPIPGISDPDGNFFALLKEQIVIYEKKAVLKEALKKKREVDADLRTKFNTETEKKEPAAPEPAAPPPSPSRFNRLRRR
ncbi:MAG: hypothetical protein QF919_16515 [Nitrospinota bacterium]|nr:hypothetical protein [Nitrospinota bacterium]